MASFTDSFKTLFIDAMSSVNKMFYFHMLLSILINTITIPLLDQLSIKYILSNDHSDGINMFIMVAITECISGIHKAYFIETHKAELDALTHEKVESHALKNIRLVTHACQKKLLGGTYETKKNAMKWNLQSLIAGVCDNIICFIPMLGYVLWISYKSPITVLTYVVGIYLFSLFNTSEFVEWSIFDKNWSLYNSFKNNQLSDLFHSRGEHCHEQMAKCMHKHELLHSQDNMLNVKQIEKINIVFNIITVINCLYVLSGNTDTAFIILYIQYVRLLKGNLQMMSSIVKRWKESEKEYNSFMKIFDDCVDIGQLSMQVDVIHNISIGSGSNFFRKIKVSGEDDKIVYEQKLTLVVRDTITMNRGTIVYVSGASGCGKTTLFDIISGVIKHNQTEFKVYIDGNKMSDGFEHVKGVRTYVATDINIVVNNVSVADIVTSNRLEDADVSMIWYALTLAQCTDFINEKNLLETDNTFSKGQVNRLKVARYMYDILSNKPSMVLMDEIADGVDPETTIKIANALFRYFRINNILCLVTTHLPYLQEMEYDSQINIAMGGIVTMA